jgi:hypothetical protein
VKTARSAALPGLLLLIVLTASPSEAQTVQPITTYRNGFIAQVAKEIAAEKAAQPTATLPVETDLFAFSALPRGSLARLLQEYEANRTDEQVGATAGASGTTTLVSKGGVPEILAFAVENGAITRSQSGTTLTFRGNANGIIKALAGRGFIQTFNPANDPSGKILDRVSFSVSFDASRGAAATPAVTGDQQQLSQWTLRAQIINQRDPLDPAYTSRWDVLAAGALTTLTQASGDLYTALEADPAFSTWLKGAQAAIAKLPADAAAIEKELRTQLDAFPGQSLSPSTTRVLADYDRAATTLVRQRKEVLDEIAEGVQVALEYTNDRPVNLPKTSNVRLVGAVGGMVDLTGNASVTLFDTIPTGLSRRVRDYQLSAELSVRLGAPDTTGPFVLAFSGKFLHQFEDSIDENGLILPNTNGTTAIAQAKLIVPVSKGTGTKMPLSITYSNRTELIKEKEVRANVGITYDLDALFARFKP